MNNDTVWMIEKSIGGIAHWWMSKTGDNGEWDDPRRWTTDPNKARKFTTKEKAEFVMGVDMPDCVATGHIWMEEGK